MRVAASLHLTLRDFVAAVFIAKQQPAGRSNPVRAVLPPV